MVRLPAVSLRIHRGSSPNLRNSYKLLRTVEGLDEKVKWDFLELPDGYAEIPNVIRWEVLEFRLVRRIPEQKDYLAIKPRTIPVGVLWNAGRVWLA